MKLSGLVRSILVGIPGGCLIFMGMLMFNAVTGLIFATGEKSMFIILCLTSLVVGLLTRLMQPFHGLTSAVVSGVIAALILLGLRLFTPQTTGGNLVFNLPGMLACLFFATLGGWLLPHLRRQR
jgi:hypothetical protein